MKKMFGLIALSLVLTSMSFASAVSYAGVNGTMSDYVVFVLSGTTLDAKVYNTGTGNVDQFTFLGPLLTPTSLPSGWTYAYGPVNFSRTNSLNTLTSPIGSGSNVDFWFTTPSGFNLGMVGNPATTDGIRFDYTGTSNYVEGYLMPTPEPSTLLLIGSGFLLVMSGLRKRYSEDK